MHWFCRCTVSTTLHVLALVLLAAAPPKGASARPWNVTFGGCVFTGDTDGSPLVRQGSCPDEAGRLDLSHKNITVVPGTAFRDMTKLGFLDLSSNIITELPRDIFAGLASLVGLSIANNAIHVRDGSHFPPDTITDEQALCYLNRYPDLQDAFEKDPVWHLNSWKKTQWTFYLEEAKKHWFLYGRNEKRDCTCQETSDPVLPETIFTNLSSLKSLAMSHNSYSRWLPGGIFVGLNLSALDVDGNMLSCVPLSIDQWDALSVYGGPQTTCEQQKEIFGKNKQRGRLSFGESLLIGICSLLGLSIMFLFVAWWLPPYRRKMAYKARFKTMDTDGDGYISQKEFCEGLSTTGQKTSKVTPSPLEESTPNQDDMHLRCVWKDVGSEISTGTEIKNELLAAALLEKVEFKKEEWDKFHLTDLSSDSYIKAGNRYFKPAEKFFWDEKKWVDEQTRKPSSLTGKSSKHAKMTFWNKNSQDLYSQGSSGPLKNFPFKWLDKDNKGKISRKEYEEGFELVEAFIQFKAGICGPLCRLLRAKYLDEKERQKTNTNIVGDVTGELVVPHPSPVPGTPSPAEIPRDGHSVCGGRCKQPSAAPKCQKCDIKTLDMGCSAVAAQGLRSAVGLDDDEVFANMMKEPEIAIECEILVAGLGGHPDGCIDDIDNYYSVKFGTSGDWQEEEIVIIPSGKRKTFEGLFCGKTGDEVFKYKDNDNCKAPIPEHVKNSQKTGKYHGGSFKKEDYDTGNKGKKLKDFHNDQASVLAGLFIYEVLILRLYTSTTYMLFNGPMRSLLDKSPEGQKSQHPLRFTIYALTEGAKKLRAVEARSDKKGFNTTKVLWRGMTNRKLNDRFESEGGTEMAVMSTTSDKKIALSYASSECPLVFKYNTVGLTRGVKIQFLSLYPKEVEYVYPPLTFLSVVRQPYVEGNVTIVQVSPQMS
jgi:hypothetical protein